MTLLADTYVDRIDFLRYLPQTDCMECGAKTCKEFADRLKAGRAKPTVCPHLSEKLRYPFQVALDADNLLPRFPCLTVPHAGPSGLVEINKPGNNSPVLISGNNIHTQDVVISILSTTKRPFFVIFADTRGDTVDMAVVLNSLTAEVVSKEIVKSRALEGGTHRKIIIPGLASAVFDELKRSTEYNLRLGPICVAELPLFLGDRWPPPAPV